jgi:glycosyltransferase involved in cell wall biosynthesis
MTRVTFASYDDTPPLGGQGVMLQGMRAALEQRGVETATVSGRGAHAIHYPRVTGRAPLDLSLHLNRHPELLLRAHPDVVHAYGGPGGVILLRRLDVPVVYTAHHTYRQAHGLTSPYRLPGPLEARAYHMAALVLAVSQSTADAVRAMGVPASRIGVLPPGVELPDLDGTSREPGRLLFVGRLERDKGVLDAVEVMRTLVRSRPDAHGVIIGAGSLAGKVKARIAGDSGIEYAGMAAPAVVRREYARAALLLMPSRYEGLGLVALEAQAAGTPVVGYDVDGLRHAAPDGGVLVPVGDVGRLQAAAEALLDDPARRDRLGASGRDFVSRQHSWERMAARLQEVYTAVSHS